MKKVRQPVLYILSSVCSWVVDEGLFYVIVRVFGTALGSYATTAASVVARVVSSLFNFNINNRLVFGNKGSYSKAMLRYYCLAIPQLAATTLLVTLSVHLLHVETAEGAAFVKIVVDACLFVASFFIQKIWVFSDKKKNSES